MGCAVFPLKEYRQSGQGGRVRHALSGLPEHRSTSRTKEGLLAHAVSLGGPGGIASSTAKSAARGPVTCLNTAYDIEERRLSQNSPKKSMRLI